MNEIKAVVIGAIHHNTLGVIRSLGESGIDASNLHILLVTDIYNKKNLITASKYVDDNNVYYVNSKEKIVSWLLDNKKKGEKKVIICCSDLSSEAVISNKNQLKDYYFCPDVEFDISKIMEKSIQDEIADRCGIVVPVGSDIDKKSYLDWNIFPCIIKPYKSIMGGKTDIHILRTKDELDKIIHSSESYKFQIQQYVEKNMEFQLIGCSLDAGNTIIIPGYTNIIRQPENTNTGYLFYTSLDNLNFDMEPVKRFIRTIGYSGLFSVEFIRGVDNKDYFLEINMRNDGNAYCVESAGVNLPYIWAYYQWYRKMPDVSLSITKDVYFIPDFNDLKVALKKEGALKWFKDFCTAQSHSIFNKNDIKPFVYEIFRLVKRVFNR